MGFSRDFTGYFIDFLGIFGNVLKIFLGFSRDFTGYFIDFLGIFGNVLKISGDFLVTDKKADLQVHLKHKANQKHKQLEKPGDLHSFIKICFFCFFN